MTNTPSTQSPALLRPGVAIAAAGALAAVIIAGFLLFLWAARGSNAGVLTDAQVQLALTGTFALFTAIALALILAIVVLKMATDKIDLSELVAEPEGGASLSRFQMLLFTFVIASLYVIYTLYSLKTGNSCVLPELTKDATPDLKAAHAAFEQAITSRHCLPTIPESVLGLIGISGGSYLLSKGIQSIADNTKGGTTPETTAPSTRANPHIPS
jgi:hypothetical protein